MKPTDHSNRRSAAPGERLAEFAGQLNTGGTQAIKEQLRTVKERLVSNQRRITELTAPAYFFALVVSVNRRAWDYKSLSSGTEVRITRTYRAGEVVSIEAAVKDSVIVRFPDEDEPIRYWANNTNPPQLKLVQWPEENGLPQPEDFLEDAAVQVIDSKQLRHTEIGTIAEEVNSAGTVKVVFTDDTYEDFWVGHEIQIEPANLPTSAAIVVHEGRRMEVPLPSRIHLEPGDFAKLSSQTLAIVGKTNPFSTGELATVSRKIDTTTCEVNHQGRLRIVMCGKVQIEQNDRVVLDSSFTMLLANHGQDDNSFSFEGVTNVSWNDIGGLADAKQQMIEIIEGPFQNQETYKAYKKKPVKGALLYGPPGCGKTTLAKAAVTALAEAYGGKLVPSAFLYVKGPELLRELVGAAEALIRQLFARAKRHKQKYGYPAIIFIDEAEALLKKRGTGVSSDISDTIVPAFLAEMDGLEESGALVLLGTNREDIIDPAALRNGRCDRKIKVTRPTKDEGLQIFGIHLKGIPVKGTSTDELVRIGTDELYADTYAIYQIGKTGENEPVTFALRDLSSGALIAGIVDWATTFAIRRDTAEKTRLQKERSGETITIEPGLISDDMTQAVKQIFSENVGLNHEDDLTEFTRDYKDSVTGIKRLRQKMA